MSDQLLIAIVAAAPGILVSLGTLAGVIITALKLKRVHTEINSRMTELLEVTAKSSKAEGVAQEADKNKKPDGPQEVIVVNDPLPVKAIK